MGDFNRPSASPFFQKENGGFDFIYQNRRQATLYCFGQSYPPAATTVFFISVGAVIINSIFLCITN